MFLLPFISGGKKKERRRRVGVPSFREDQNVRLVLGREAVEKSDEEVVVGLPNLSTGAADSTLISSGSLSLLFYISICYRVDIVYESVEDSSESPWSCRILWLSAQSDKRISD